MSRIPGMVNYYPGIIVLYYTMLLVYHISPIAPATGMPERLDWNFRNTRAWAPLFGNGSVPCLPTVQNNANYKLLRQKVILQLTNEIR